MMRHAAPRRGFTLIEILIVIGIIAVLASLLVVTIPKITRSMKNTETITDIAQISNAIGTYKSKMGVGYIPSGGGGTAGSFRLCSSYVDKNGAILNWPEVVYLKQVFPQMNLSDNGLRIGKAGSFVMNDQGGAVPNGVPSVPMLQLDGNQTLVFFLTGGPPTELQGFSTNRTQPFTKLGNANENRLGPFVDFPLKRYAGGAAAVSSFRASTNASQNEDGAASLLDPRGAPYAYFAFSTSTNTYMTTSYVYRGQTVTPYMETATKAYNPKGFQLISPGDNALDDATSPVGLVGFGAGGATWVPGAGEYAEGKGGADDLSNFNGGMLITKN